MAGDNKDAKGVNLITTPHENQTPAIEERQEQLETLAWAVRI